MGASVRVEVWELGSVACVGGVLAETDRLQPSLVSWSLVSLLREKVYSQQFFEILVYAAYHPRPAARSAIRRGAPRSPSARQMAETLFVKVERVRRLHSARLVDVDVHRGEDGSFGIGLSDDNVVTNFHHSTNTASLQLGDQVCKVDGVTLVRERLAHLVQRQFADVQQVCKTGLGSGSGLATALRSATSR